MSASPPATGSPSCRKRTYDDIDGLSLSPSKDLAMIQSSIPSSQFPNLPTPPFVSTTGSTASSRLTSPAPSSSAVSVSGPPPSTVTASNASTASAKLVIPTPTKKRRLTASERETKRLKKETKDREKAEEKARNDEEKRVKDEERRRKKEVEEEEKRQRELKKAEQKKTKDAETQKKDEERRKKEDEKRKKEEEKNKRDKSQLRLGSFFKKPEPTPASPASAADSRRNSIDFVIAQDFVASVSASAPDVKGSVTRASDYRKSFPPFFLQTNTSLAPSNRFSKDEDALNFARAQMDSHLKGTAHSLSGPSSFSAYHLFQIVPHRRGVDKGVSLSVKDILLRMQGSSNAPIDLTDSGISQNLKSIPMKLLHFREDVRPPYQGTFTKPLSPRSAKKIARNPFHRALPDTDYDYDSEAEWEEPEEGEDLDSEVEDDTSEAGDEDMEDFLDDEDDLIKGKRRAIVGDLEPCSSGLCWEDPSHGWKTENSNLDLSSYRLEVMLDSVKTPINPFSTDYWPCARSTPSFVKATEVKPISLMNPPRAPLHSINNTNAIINATHPLSISGSGPSTKPVSGSIPTASQMQSKAASKPKRIIADSMLPQFKQAVEGSNLTKAGLIEVLKKQFPKVSKDVIKDTLNAVAVREGQKEADKKWVIIATEPGPGIERHA